MILFYYRVNFSQYFPIKEVKVAGLDHVDHREVQRALLPLVNKGFFAIDVETIKERLIAISLGFGSVCQRNWPNQVIIKLSEKKPVARWNNERLLKRQWANFSSFD